MDGNSDLDDVINISTKRRDFEESSSLSVIKNDQYSRGELAYTAPNSVAADAEKISAKKKIAVLGMIEQNWRTNLKSEIENNISNQVNLALKPLIKELPTIKRAYHKRKFTNNMTSFKYISNFDETNNGSSKNQNHKTNSTNDYSLLKTKGMYQFDELKRRRKNFSEKSLNFALVDTDTTNIEFFRSKASLDNNTANNVPFLETNNSSQSKFSIPDYGINRKCFNSYTKEGTQNLLASKTRRKKLNFIGKGRYVDKKGVVISKLGPFWPRGFGPVCQANEFLTNGLQQEKLSESYFELMKGEKAALKSKMMENSHQEMGDKWRGKPVVFDSDRSTKSPVFHFVPDGFQPSLEFESRFESGNLRQARRTGENEYELVLRTDMYTNRHTQWYYFRVKNAKPNTTYKFNIINLLKKDSLYNYGMRPLVYSELQAKQDDKGWFRLGEKIRYIPWNNPTKNSMLSLDMQYYCLQFEMSFNWEGVENDVIYMAHCYPYTYTDLRRHLDEMLSCPIKSKHVRKEILCETAAGNACFLLTITNFKSNEEEFAFEEHYEDPYKGKKGVVLTSRVHPGETQASWMMKGILDFLTSNHPNAQKLRHKYIFKVIPMMNPDGVIVGNYRTSLSARDLNRNYRHPKQEAFPTVWHTKQMVEKLHQKYPIVLYCDLHGHSRRHLVFMYGCERKKRRNREDGDEEQNLLEARHFVQQRLFPWILHRLTPSRFSFQQTKFSVRKSKESTGRVVMFKQMGIENSFTLEATFSGTPKGRHFNINDFLMVGRKLCESILEYSRLEEDPAAKSRVIVDMTREIAEHARKIALKQKQQNQSAASTKEKYAVTKKDSKHEPGTNKTKDTRIQKSLLTKPSHKARSTSSSSSEKSVLTQKEFAKNTNPEISKNIIHSPSSDKDCFELIQNLDVFQYNNDSGSSSESNSDSDPELDESETILTKVLIKPNKQEAQQSTKKRKRKKVKANSSSKLKLESVETEQNLKQQRSKSCPEQSEFLFKSSFSENQSLKKLKVNPHFVSKFAHRSNGGIPIFSEERLHERALRRMVEIRERGSASSDGSNHKKPQPNKVTSLPQINVKKVEDYLENCGLKFVTKKNHGRFYLMQEREPTNENIDFVRGSKLKYSPNKLKVRSNSEKQIRIKKNADVTQFKLQPPEDYLDKDDQSITLATFINYGLTSTSLRNKQVNDKSRPRRIHLLSPINRSSGRNNEGKTILLPKNKKSYTEKLPKSLAYNHKNFIDLLHP